MSSLPKSGEEASAAAATSASARHRSDANGVAEVLKFRNSLVRLNHFSVLGTNLSKHGGRVSDQSTLGPRRVQQLLRFNIFVISTSSMAAEGSKRNQKKPSRCNFGHESFAEACCDQGYDNSSKPTCLGVLTRRKDRRY